VQSFCFCFVLIFSGTFSVVCSARRADSLCHVSLQSPFAPSSVNCNRVVVMTTPGHMTRQPVAVDRAQTFIVTVAKARTSFFLDIIVRRIAVVNVVLICDT